MGGEKCADACGKLPSVFETLADYPKVVAAKGENIGQKRQHNSVREPSDPSSSNSGLDVSPQQNVRGRRGRI